jgi:hypothetical protein
MSNIKICKPRSQVSRKNLEQKPTMGEGPAKLPTRRLPTEGLGCVPTGNIIDRD